MVEQDWILIPISLVVPVHNVLPGFAQVLVGLEAPGASGVCFRGVPTSRTAKKDECISVMFLYQVWMGKLLFGPEGMGSSGSFT